MGKLVKNGRDYTGGGGITSYNGLNDKPSINSVELSGNKTADALGLVTKAVNDLVNYYLKTETYSKTEVDAIVTAIKNSRFEVVSSLPTTDIKTNVIYLVPSADPQTSNVKDEYINLDGTTAGWEKIGSTSVDLSGYVTDTELNTALANYTTTTDLTTLLAGKQDKIQVTTMPTASATTMNRIYQFMGTTDSTYTHGYFYETKESSGNYSWQQVNVQPNSGGGGGGGHTIEDSEGTDLTQRDTLQFGEGFTASDDSQNEKTVITPDVMQSGDMDDVLTPLPSVQTRYQKYSTSEQVVGEWIDGKPVYQRIFTGATPVKTPTSRTEYWFYENEMPTNIDTICKIDGCMTLIVSDKYPSDIGTDTNYCPLACADMGNGNFYMATYVYSNLSPNNHRGIRVFARMDSQWFAFSPTVILQYTKTTDTPNT